MQELETKKPFVRWGAACPLRKSCLSAGHVWGREEPGEPTCWSCLRSAVGLLCDDGMVEKRQLHGAEQVRLEACDRCMEVAA